MVSRLGSGLGYRYRVRVRVSELSKRHRRARHTPRLEEGHAHNQVHALVLRLLFWVSFRVWVRVRVRVGVRAWKEGSGARRTGRVRVGEFRG